MKLNAKVLMTIISMAVFVALIGYEWSNGVYEYIADTIFFMTLTLILLLLYKKLDLDLWCYASFILALMFHNAGAFGWYNISPLPLQWDHITHITGIFAPTLILFRFSRRFFSHQPFHNGYVILFTLLAALGIGVFVEFYEFAGYFIVGEGVGGLGQGEGDFTTELGESLWLNTMLDMVFNVIGALFGLAGGFLLRYHKEG